MDASVAMYRRVELELLPTPAKSHYTFNLRDLSKVFQGVGKHPYRPFSGCAVRFLIILMSNMHSQRRFFSPIWCVCLLLASGCMSLIYIYISVKLVVTVQ